MAKHSFPRIRRMQATRLLLFAALVLGLGVSPSWAGPQSSKSSPPNANSAQAAGQNKARTTPAKSAKTAAQSKGTTATSSSSTLGAGKRDPFRLPVPGGGEGGGPGGPVANSGGNLGPGKRGLVISHLTLEGTVREQTENKMTALVIDDRKLAYFLHENDSVYDGVVSKITPDAVYFKENVIEPDGRVTTREVVKRLSSASGEGR